MLEDLLIRRQNPPPRAVALNRLRTSPIPLHLQLTSIDTLVTTAWEALGPATADRNIFLRNSNLGEVLCDPVLLQQVFVDLFANAIKHTRGRSPAVLQVGTFMLEGDQVVFVRDNGTGFDTRYEDNEGGGGSLSTVTSIIHEHGGRTWATPGVGRDATFYFTLRAPVTPRTLPHRDDDR